MPGMNINPDGSSRPVPDPTTLTTEALIRAVENERDYVDGQIGILIVRIDSMDTATRLLSETLNRVPTVMQIEIAHIKALVDEKFLSVDHLVSEKFGSIATQFAERDTRQEREARDNKVAVDAAFAAQKEAAARQDESNQKAIDKSEKTTAETISKLGDLTKTTTDGLSDRILTSSDALNDKIADLKGRLDRGEGGSAGVAENKQDHRGYVQTILQSVAVVVTMIGLVILAYHK